MKLMLLILATACLALTVNALTVVEEELPRVEGQLEEQPIEGDVTEVILIEEPTTKKSSGKPRRVTTTTTTTLPTPESTAVIEAAVDEVTPAPVVPTKSRKPSNRRPSGTRRKSPSKSKVDKEENVDVKEENPKADMTSPASVDTASISALAPKNFKPTPKPIDEFQQAQGLMEFLKKRKIERLQATTTEDPFVAILATATAPSTSESVTAAVDSSPSRFGSGSSRRLPSTGRRIGNNARIATTSTTTTETPVTEETTVAAAAATVTSRRSRFGGSRNKNTATTVTTEATTTPAAESKPMVDTLARSKLFPKRPANLRPVGNSISRRKDQASSTTEAPAPSPVAVEEEVIGVPEEIEPVEPTTTAPLRRARGRLAARISRT